jgi:plasmid stabilization system protein ParE
MNLRFRPDAGRDIDRAREWYGTESLELEFRFSAALAASLAIILKYPRAFQEWRGGVRQAPVPAFPYLVYYVQEGNDIAILRILHTKRRP